MKAIVSVFLGVILLLASCGGIDSEARLAGTPVLSPEIQGETRTRIDFARHVKPILEQRCVWCHSGKDKDLAYSLANRDAAFQNQRVVPGKASKSLLYLAASGQHPALKTPNASVTVAPSDQIVLRRWIESGAVWPAGPTGELKGR